jgi:hypothetical protein
VGDGGSVDGDVDETREMLAKHLAELEALGVEALFPERRVDLVIDADVIVSLDATGGTVLD